jgi:hypothetical protein
MVNLLSASTKTRLLACIALVALALVAVWLSLRGSTVESARDFEECVEALRANPGSNDERGSSMTNCNARFAGRRKPGGGYSYYDFMQGRSFDIAGPNPTAEERRQIDHEYIEFLDAQRRETVSAELAKRQNEQLRADMEADMERERQPVGPPLVLTPKNLPSPKQLADRSKSAHCEDNSLACSWSKLSAAVKNAFAWSSRTKP